MWADAIIQVHHDDLHRARLDQSSTIVRAGVGYEATSLQVDIDGEIGVCCRVTGGIDFEEQTVFALAGRRRIARRARPDAQAFFTVLSYDISHAYCSWLIGFTDLSR